MSALNNLDSKLNATPSAKKILVMMSGSIAAYKVCALLSQLIQKGFQVKVVMSPAATQFIGASTIEGLTGEAPHTDLYARGQAMEHISVQRWADIILIAPATANTINKLASGIGDDLLSTIYLAHDFQKPFLIAPAMNTKMYQHPATQSSIQKLRQQGVEILESASGVLACGEVGYGRLLEPNLILKEVERFLGPSLPGSENLVLKNDLQRKEKIKVLITSGGTQEPLDDVRVLTNKSTGRTGAYLADQMIETGFEVTYLHAETARQPLLSCQKISFITFNDLDKALENELKKNYNCVIHAAGVSDYSFSSETRNGATRGKINSDQETLTITLKRNPKLIEKIKKLAPNTKLVGFKLTSTNDEKIIQEKIDRLFAKAHCDYVVHNDWSTVQAGQNGGQHRFNFIGQNEFYENLTLDDLSAHMIQSLCAQICNVKEPNP